MQPSIHDDLVHHYLPIGVLGLINQLVNIYIQIQIYSKNRPLWPTRKIKYRRQSMLLCTAATLFVIGFDITSLRRLQRWDLIVSVVGDLIIFTQFNTMQTMSLDMDGYGSPKKVETDSARQGEGPPASSEASTLQGDEPPPPYSKDPEKGDTTIDGDRQVSNLEEINIPDITESDRHTDRLSTTGIETKEPPLNLNSDREETTNSARVETCTGTKTQTAETKKVEPDSDNTPGAFVFYLILQLPATILVSTGLVAQLVQSPRAVWTEVEHMKPIIIAFSIPLAATVVATCIYLVRIGRRPRPSDACAIAKRRSEYMDCILMGLVGLNFFIVSFDKWVLAALAEDIVGTKHILEASHLAIPYILLSKLPALAL